MTPEGRQIIAKLKLHKAELFAKYPLKSLGIFGSATRNDFTPQSDVDVMVEFQGPIGLKVVNLADEIEQLLKKKIDLVPKDAIKPRMWPYIEGDLIMM